MAEKAGTGEKAIIFSADRCSGCRVCELVCSQEHQGEYNPSRSYIRITANEAAATYIPVLDIRCDFCGRCVEACPMEALRMTGLAEAVIERKGSPIGEFPLPVFNISG